MGYVSSPGEEAHVMRDWLRSNAGFVIAVLLLLAMTVTLSILASRTSHFPGDEYLMGLVRSIRLPYFDGLMHLVTYLGTLVPVIVMAALATAGFWYWGHRLEAIFVVLSLSDELLSWTSKALVHRPRPLTDLLRGVPPEATSSFPSGHAVHFVVFFGLLMFFAHSLIDRRWLRVTIYVVGGALIILVGISRIYLGVHWPSDVLGGYMLGGLWLLILVRACLAARGRA